MTTTTREVRASWSDTGVVMYQAYNHAIADAAVAAGRFVAPFSFGRMTWVKPSFLWMMERSNWGRKANQERILAVRITRAGLERALSLAVLTSFERNAHASHDAWRAALDASPVRVQWDPERTIRGASVSGVDAIQIGLGRGVVDEFVREWIVAIDDVTLLVRKMRRLLDDGEAAKASALLPAERVYPVDDAATRRRLAM